MEVAVTGPTFEEAKKTAAVISDMMADEGCKFISATTRRKNGWSTITLRFEPKDT